MPDVLEKSVDRETLMELTIYEVWYKNFTDADKYVLVPALDAKQACEIVADKLCEESNNKTKSQKVISVKARNEKVFVVR